MSMDGVIKALEAAVQAAPDDLDLRRHLIDQLLEAERVADAVSEAESLLAADAADPDNVRLAARANRAAGDAGTADALDSAADALEGGHGSSQVPSEPDSDERANHDAEPLVPVPDTVDQLIDSWQGSEAIEEVDIGELGEAGITLEDVGGLSEVKQQLERTFLGPIRNPAMAAAFGKSGEGGLLLWGPPGCGKTFLARAIAGEMGASFYNVAITDVLEMWQGNSPRNLAKIFESARRNAPCVLFFDEVDALGQKRSNLQFAHGLRTVVNQLLSELDGVLSSNEGLFVLAATNHPWDIDEALLRPGRFDRRLLVLPPDPAARETILSFHLRGKPTEAVHLDAVVAATDGYSGADLRFIVETATEVCLEASMATDTIVPITTARLRDAFETVPPTTGPWLENARNHVMYANRSGHYDELEAYLKSRDAKRRRR